MLQNLWAIS